MNSGQIVYSSVMLFCGLIVCMYAVAWVVIYRLGNKCINLKHYKHTCERIFLTQHAVDRGGAMNVLLQHMDVLLRRVITAKPWINGVGDVGFDTHLAADHGVWDGMDFTVSFKRITDLIIEHYGDKSPVAEAVTYAVQIVRESFAKNIADIAGDDVDLLFETIKQDLTYFAIAQNKLKEAYDGLH